jgi:hypothetical protein
VAKTPFSGSAALHLFAKWISGCMYSRVEIIRGMPR